jgi:hypothetical protein
MAPPSSFRAVYKVVDGQEIDVDVYLPQVATSTAKKNAGHPISAFSILSFVLTLFRPNDNIQC